MVPLAAARHAIPVVDRSEPRPWSPGPVFAALERALDWDDVEWCADAPLRGKLRRHRRRVVSLCVAELRLGAQVALGEWRRQAAARADYSGPDPLWEMMAIQGLLWGVEGLATWTLTWGLAKPAGSAAILARLRMSLPTLPEALPAA